MLGYGLTIRHRWFLVVSLALLLGLLPIFAFSKPALGAGTLLDGFEQKTFASGLTSPTAMEFAPDGRLFVTEIGGTLRVIDTDGTLLPTPFVDISDKVDSRGGRGLLGVTLDPNFSTNNFVYLHYTQKATDGAPAHNRVVRFTAEGDTAQVGSEQLIFRMNNLGNSTKHNGGAIHFGNDGMLYIAVGDNKRDRTAPRLNTQGLDNLLGKMLRIEPEPNAEPNTNIPTDNPFYNVAEGENRAIWALGLRNPYTFAVQPVRGKIHINDVGEQRFEEINLGQAGANYGWPRYGSRENNPNYENPIFTYKHDDLPHTPHTTSGCAITGGAFYNPQTLQFPAEYEGDYFFADFCNGWIRKLDADGEGASGFATGANMPVDLKVSEDGSLYYLELGSGSVKKISYAPPTTP